MGPREFYPKDIIIEPGTKVVWYNNSTYTHNVYPLIKKYLTKNKAYGKLFKTVGIYKYHCVPHRAMGMTGTIIVKEKK